MGRPGYLRAGIAAAFVAVLALVWASVSGAQLPSLPVQPPTLGGPSAPVVNPTVAPDRSVEPVVLTGASFPGWAAPANQTAKIPLTDLKDCPPGSNTDNCQHNRYVQPEVNAQLPIAGTPIDRLLGYRWTGSRFVQIPFQVDKLFTRYIENDASGFGVYSGVDQHTTYQYPREGFRYTASAPGNPCLARPDSPSATDPVKGLDTNDELAFMASDAGAQAPANAPLPHGIDGVRVVAVRDPFNQGATSYVYVMKAAAGGPRPAYNASNGYVSYMRDPNSDFFEHSESSYSSYGNAAKGIVCDAQGHPIIDPKTGKPVIARRRPRDYATVTTPRYRFRYDGRWLLTAINISPDGGRSYGPNLVDRWKARAFQQDPSSNTPCCGFEEEDTHWGGSSTLLGEKVGPVRAIRETWGADSGTNVIRRETFYRDQVRMKTWLRVHPIPPLDGIYAQWDFAAGRMTRFYNPNVPNGVPVDGRNDTVFGNLDDPCNDNYNDNQLGTGPVDPNQTYRQLYQQTMLCKVSPYHQSINISDPTFEAANAALSWSETTGPWGTIVDRYQIDQVTDETPGGLPQSLVAVPYYRDDSCFDDGTGNDPGPRLKPGSADEPRTTPSGAPRKCWTPSDGIPAPGDARYYQGDIGTHGLHLLFEVESDNARMTVPIDEIVSEQRLVMLPGARGNVGEQYGREFEKPLVATVGSYNSSSTEVDGGGPATYAASGGVSPSNPLGLPANSACKGPARFKLALHQPRHARIVKVKVYADGKLVAARRARRVTAVTIPHLLQANEVVKVVAITNRGRRIVTARVYRGCMPKAAKHRRARHRRRAHHRRRR